MMISFEVHLRRIYSSPFSLRLAIGRDEANLPRRGNIIAAVLLGRREAHCEQVVIRGHNTLGDSFDPHSIAIEGAREGQRRGWSGTEWKDGRSSDREGL